MTFFLSIITISFIEAYLLFFLSQIDSFSPYNIIGKIDYSNVIIVVFLITNLVMNALSFLAGGFLIQREKIKKKKDPNYNPITIKIKKTILYTNIIASLVICAIWTIYIAI
ncbi:MAG TPA: hypothetical protein PK957_00685 [Candidatus Dojkabacteria bacterium]|nr:hypothetical protein [Candidatus Dojkabacteria bacterium]HQF36706.1 hypothetical protein [Candidatus Dojkabacteria bacterium]